MKKLLMAALLALCSITHAQNPTLVYGTNGVRMYPATTHAGKTTVGLDTNLTGFAVNTSPMWNGSAFVWSAAGGIPTNWTWTAGVLTNTMTSGSLKLGTQGGQTNTASLFSGEWAGAITFGDANAVQMFRETTGLGWSVRTAANANITFKVGGTQGWRGSAVVAGGTIGSGDTSMIYAEDASAGAYNHILPAIGANDSKVFKFYKNDNTTNEVHICTAGGTLFSNGQTNYVLYANGDSITVWNNAGATWDILQSTSYPKLFSWFHKDSEIVTGNALTVGVLATQVNNEQTFQSAAASNDVFRIKAYLARGTNYHLYALGTTDSSRGIQRWQITDGAGTRTIDSFDWYNAVNQLNIQKTSLAFSVLQPGYVVITSTVTNKNASSSDFVIALTRVKISEP